jgi:hypothetical protein
MAGATGLEPATSGVTGRRSNQLSYAPAALIRGVGYYPATPGVSSLAGAETLGFSALQRACCGSCERGLTGGGR